MGGVTIPTSQQFGSWQAARDYMANHAEEGKPYGFIKDMYEAAPTFRVFEPEVVEELERNLVMKHASPSEVSFNYKPIVLPYGATFGDVILAFGDAIKSFDDEVSTLTQAEWKKYGEYIFEFNVDVNDAFRQHHIDEYAELDNLPEGLPLFIPTAVQG